MEEQNQELLKGKERQVESMDQVLDFSQVHSLRVLTVLIWPKIWTDKIATFIPVSMSTIPKRGCKQVKEWEIRNILIHPLMQWALIRNKSM